MKKNNFLIIQFYTLFFVFICFSCFGSPRNLLPRFPEIILQEGNSSDYRVEALTASVVIEGEIATTNTFIKLKNISDKASQALLKFRILYPIEKSPVVISIDNKPFKYSTKNNLYKLTLNPNEEKEFIIKAKVSTNYSINAVRKLLQAEEKAKSKQTASFAEDFARFFNTEKYGARFMIGTIISKWGIFPIEMKSVLISVKIPAQFILVVDNKEAWSQTQKSNQKSFEFSLNEGFNQAVFLPNTDEQDFIETQQILNSKQFKH